MQWNQVPVVFENVQFKRPVQFQNGKVKLTVKYTEQSGEFFFLNDGHTAACRKIFADMKSQSFQLQHLIRDICSFDKIKYDYELNSQEFYKELRTRGYDYGPQFQGVQKLLSIDKNISIGKVTYTNNSNFISTLDSVLQLMIIAIPNYQRFFFKQIGELEKMIDFKLKLKYQLKM